MITFFYFSRNIFGKSEFIRAKKELYISISMKSKLTKFALICSLCTVGAIVFGCAHSEAEVKPFSDTVVEEDDEYDVIDSFTQGGMNHTAREHYNHFADSVNGVYKEFEALHPECFSQEEKQAMERYFSAAEGVYKAIFMGMNSGSAAPMGFWAFMESLQVQKLNSFASVASHGCVAEEDIANAYQCFAEWGLDTFSETPLQKQKSLLEEEQKHWNSWMEERKKVSESLPKPNKVPYDNRTNELKRLKLIQLKNQYQEYGLMTDEMWDKVLKENCNDQELASYRCFGVEWEEYEKALE